MAPKSVIAEFFHRILKKPHEKSRSNNPEFVGFEDPKITSALGSSVSSNALQKPFIRNKAE